MTSPPAVVVCTDARPAHFNAQAVRLRLFALDARHAAVNGKAARLWSFGN